MQNGYIKKLWIIVLVVLMSTACKNKAGKNANEPAAEKASDFATASICVSEDGNYRLISVNTENGTSLTDVTHNKVWNLDKTPSASGVKYANKEGFTFWTKGNDFIWSNHMDIITSGKLVNADNESAQTTEQVVWGRILSFQKMHFFIISVKKMGICAITISPFGLQADNRTVTDSIAGSVVGAEIADLNADGSPEIMVFTQSDGSGSYGNVLAYSVNNKKSMSNVYFPPVSENGTLSKGYMGHDEFRVVDNSLVQRFPIYNEGDTNANPTGGIRQITYKLTDGEASRRFEIDNIVTVKN